MLDFVVVLRMVVVVIVDELAILVVLLVMVLDPLLALLLDITHDVSNVELLQSYSQPYDLEQIEEVTGSIGKWEHLQG